MLVVLATVAAATSSVALGQAGPPTSLTRAAAIAIAEQHGPRLAIAASDTAVAAAQLVGARAYPDPQLAASYSRSLPTYHVSVDIPLDLPMTRGLRIGAATAGFDAARLRYEFAVASIRLDADTMYTHAVAAREHLLLSRRNTAAGDSLLHIVERRRDAGDASDMDVELARINAGQQANVAAADSLAWIATLLDLQAVLGYSSDSVLVSATDSLTAPSLVPTALPSDATLGEAAASLALQSANLEARLQRRSIWSQFSISLGFERGDPSQPGVLPTVGVGFGLPLFNRNRGAIAVADAERMRAGAELALARIDARNRIAHASRERQNALAKIARDRSIIASAQHVAAMSLTAYSEGAMALPNVLDAQRSARDVLGSYIDDLANAWDAIAELRVLSLSPSSSPQSP